MSIKDINIEDRPREKLLTRGVDVLSNEELLQVIIGSGIKGHDVVSISEEIMKTLLEKDGKITINDLKEIKGVSIATATKLLASLEVANRLVKGGTVVRNVEDVAMILADIRTKTQEHFMLLTLDGANKLVNRYTISVGTLNASMIHPRDIFSRALQDNAASIIVAHNHPSGTLEPSGADMEVTRRVKKSGKDLGIPLKAHVLLTKNDEIEIK